MAFNLLMPTDFTHQGHVIGKYWMHVDGLTTNKLSTNSGEDALNSGEDALSKLHVLK